MTLQESRDHGQLSSKGKATQGYKKGEYPPPGARSDKVANEVRKVPW